MEGRNKDIKVHSLHESFQYSIECFSLHEEFVPALSQHFIATVHPKLSPPAAVHPKLSPPATVHAKLSPPATVHAKLSPTATVHAKLSPTATVHAKLSPTAAIRKAVKNMKAWGQGLGLTKYELWANYLWVGTRQDGL